MQELGFYFSPGSRYSYLALSQVPLIEKDFGIQFDWIPIVGERIREIRGADPFMGEPQSGQYDWEYRRKDAETWADFYHIPFQEPKSHKMDTNLLGRAVLIAKKLKAEREYSWELASEIFARGTWPVDEVVIVNTAKKQNLDPEVFKQGINSDHYFKEIEAICQAAVNRGIFGSPAFFVGDKMFWGNDRIPLLKQELSRIMQGNI